MTLRPTAADKFTFGLWTVGNRGRDPRRVRSTATGSCRRCSSPCRDRRLGRNHDNDLVPIDATPAERDRIVSDFRKALDATGVTVPMATTNLFTDPVFKDGRSPRTTLVSVRMPCRRR